MSRVRLFELAVLLVLLGAAAYEAAIAVQWIPVGTQPGDGARFEGIVLVAAVIAMLAGIVLALLHAARAERSGPAGLFGTATAALMVAHYYTFDTYYLPTHTRYSDSGPSPTWVYTVAIAGGLASLLAFLRPRIGFSASAVVIVLCLFTIIFAGVGK